MEMLKKDNELNTAIELLKNKEKYNQIFIQKKITNKMNQPCQITDWLPTTSKEVKLRGWEELDVILFSETRMLIILRLVLLL